MSSSRFPNLCLLSVLVFCSSAALPAGAQFVGGGFGAGGGPAAPPSARKIVEDDGISPYVIAEIRALPDDAPNAGTPASTPSSWKHWEPDEIGGINKNGDLCLNWMQIAGGRQAGMYHADSGKITRLLPLPGTVNAETRATGLSDDGQAVGSTNTFGNTVGIFHPLLWKAAQPSDPTALPVDLWNQKDSEGRPQEGDQATVCAVSPDGHLMAGDVTLNFVGDVAAAWSGGTMYRLGSLTNQGIVRGCAINNHGQVAGVAAVPLDDAHPLTTGHGFLYTSGAMTDLGALLPGVSSGARAINADGVVAGWSASTDVMVVHRSDIRAVIWKDGIITSLGTLPGGSSSTACGISDNGQVVGYSSASDTGSGQPFLWKNGKMSALSSLIPAGTGWDLGTAQINYGGEGFLCINASGQIAGVGARDHRKCVFLLTPRSLLKK